jgi:antirestriction protein ArdC
MKNKKGYAFEELVAEISAAYLMANLGISPQVRDDHADYIGAWLSALDDDHKYIFDAASAAQKAVDFVMNEMTTEHQLLTA